MLAALKPPAQVQRLTHEALGLVELALAIRHNAKVVDRDGELRIFANQRRSQNCQCLAKRVPGLRQPILFFEHEAQVIKRLGDIYRSEERRVGKECRYRWWGSQ